MTEESESKSSLRQDKRDEEQVKMLIRETVPSQTSDMGKKTLSVLAH